MTQRGRVQRDTSVGDGVVAVDGKQYAFQLEGVWQSELPPRAGMLVDVNFDSVGVPARIVAVPDAQLTREQAEQALATARRQGGVLAGTIRSRFGLAVFGAELGLLLSFFVLPSVTIPIAGRSFSAWDVIGMDVRTTMVDDHGVLSFLAILCLFAPLAVPFVKLIWARWLYLAPLIYSLIAAVTIYMQMESAEHTVEREAGAELGALGGQFAREVANQASGMLHLSVGIFAIFACALYLAFRVRQP